MNSVFVHDLKDIVSVLIAVFAMTSISVLCCILSASADWEDAVEVEEIELVNYASFVGNDDDRNALIPGN